MKRLIDWCVPERALQWRGLTRGMVLQLWQNSRGETVYYVWGQWAGWCKP